MSRTSKGLVAGIVAGAAIMAAPRDGGMRETEAIVASQAVRESFSLAGDEVDATLHVAFRMDDDSTPIRVNRWEVQEVGAQLVANAVEAMGAGGTGT